MDSENEVNIQILSEVEMAKLNEEVRSELKAERAARMERLRETIQYRVPLTKFAKADVVCKIVGTAKSQGVAFPKDVQIAMGLQRGQMVKVTVELFPDDAAKLFSSL